METKHILQLFAAGLILLGLLGIVAGSVPGIWYFGWEGREAWYVGVGLLGAGVVMFADVRRRLFGDGQADAR
ncbi:hypothetical protein [Haloglomus litoreum]|uniref:hypothetical protein n=1 Tax=Haloglomus litoreum TaxID=3034026 RepID=UPI0023E7BDF0|nr:hypothetical protein [Haloglomus sp. DT116]